VKRVRPRNRLVGFTYDEAAGVAHFSMYLPGSAGRDRKRATVNAATYDEAVRLWSEFRSRAAEGLTRPSPEAPTFREFITDDFPSIAANLATKTARDYRWAIDRHLLPQLGALRLDEITSGILNRPGARLNAAGYAGAMVNNYVNLAALLLGYAVELDVIADLPLKKRLKKQKSNKPCLELNAEERARFLTAFDDEDGFRHFLAANSGRPVFAAVLRSSNHSMISAPMREAYRSIEARCSCSETPLRMTTFETGCANAFGSDTNTSARGSAAWMSVAGASAFSKSGAIDSANALMRAAASACQTCWRAAYRARSSSSRLCCFAFSKIFAALRGGNTGAAGGTGTKTRASGASERSRMRPTASSPPVVCSRSSSGVTLSAETGGTRACSIDPV
jgi:hypothetical protein